MSTFDEKKAIYDQMTKLIEERRVLTRAYYELKKELVDLKRNEIKENEVSRKDNTNLSSELENQKYFMDRRTKKYSGVCYQDMALKIASYLKEKGIPVATGEIYSMLKEKYQIFISYKNLVGNILPKIKNDSSINIERASRGYWQYRVK
ncbi:hypothetical protein ACWY2R_07785 [Enterococcus avium]